MKEVVSDIYLKPCVILTNTSRVLLSAWVSRLTAHCPSGTTVTSLKYFLGFECGFIQDKSHLVT